MKTESPAQPRQFLLKVLSYGNHYYIKRIAKLEAVLARAPRLLQLDLMGVGEIPADAALLIRSIVRARSPATQIITNARSSLQGGSVLVWLLGDRRIIRDDARVYFRRANPSEDDEADQADAWKQAEPKYCDSFSETDPEEGDYQRVLELINEFLPVKELAGRLLGVPVLRQFGLVDNEQLDQFLASALGKPPESKVEPRREPEAGRTPIEFKGRRT
jgi:hypothetical protein